MAQGILGKDGKLWYFEGEQGSATWVEATSVRTVTPSIEKGEADASSRAGGGWKQWRGTLKDATVEVELLYVNGDPFYEALLTSLTTDSVIALQILDGEPGDGIQGDFECFNLSQPQELEGVITVTASLKVASTATPPSFITNESHEE